jgi:hypothetical protein
VASSQRYGHWLSSGRFEEGQDPLVDAELRDLALGDAGSPIACTRWSTRRVETPPIQASWITATKAFLVIFRGSRNGGK